jgi:hypothetical protein
MQTIYFANTVNGLTGEVSIRLVVDPANADPTLAIFHEVKHAAQEGPQPESCEQQYRGTDAVRRAKERNG